MNVMSTKEEWLYRLVIDNIRLKARDKGEYIIDVFLSGIPKDKYDSQLVLKIIGHVQGEASEILDEIMKSTPVFDYDKITKDIKTKLIKKIFGE